ncbi:hypothetical protein Golax_025738 [Gossypium laxum]|uniref:RNase H type-1 domain-containing protein n=1 Tax=Gossypium laxum TaxID=34288 RepID=A0A7J9AYU4_9ROSI|nr:hypothetical protein [Gossypium laxum]
MSRFLACLSAICDITGLVSLICMCPNLLISPLDNGMSGCLPMSWEPQLRIWSSAFPFLRKLMMISWYRGRMARGCTRYGGTIVCFRLQTLQLFPTPTDLSDIYDLLLYVLGASSRLKLVSTYVLTALLLPGFGTTCKSHGQLISLEYLSKTERLLGRILGAECWRPPKGTMLKVNFDAAFNVHSMRSCTGLMFRDRLCRVIGSHLVLTAHVPSAFTAEALACLYAVRLAVDLDLQEVIFEGDSLTVIRKACSPLHDISTIRAYIQVVKAMTFRRCLFVHIPRKGNSFAHLLATTGMCGGVCSSLGRVIPNFAYLAAERELPAFRID